MATRSLTSRATRAVPRFAVKTLACSALSLDQADTEALAGRMAAAPSTSRNTTSRLGRLMASRWPALTVIAPSESGPVTETVPFSMRTSSCSPVASQPP